MVARSSLAVLHARTERIKSRIVIVIFNRFIYGRLRSILGLNKEEREGTCLPYLGLLSEVLRAQTRSVKEEQRMGTSTDGKNVVLSTLSSKMNRMVVYRA